MASTSQQMSGMNPPQRQTRPPPPTNVININGQDYDLNNPTDSATVVAALAQQVNNQATTIQQLQTQPTITQNQAQTFVNALTGALGGTTATPGQVNQVENPVLSVPGRPVYYEEHPVPVGITDIKNFPKPDEYKGSKLDAEPFIIRLKAYFSATPKAMKFTRARILYTCDLLKHPKTNGWAELVRKAIATGTNNEYYYDEWDLFQREFLKRYGLTNAPQHHFRLLVNLRQGPQTDCKQFVDEFERLRGEAKMTKDAAQWYLEQATYAPYRTRLNMRENPPRIYDDWCEALVKLQSQIDKEREYRIAAIPYQPHFSNGKHPQQAHSNKPKGWGTPMDVDALRTKKKFGSKKPSTTGPRKPSKNASKPPSHSQPPPSYKSTSKPNPSGSSMQKARKPFYCYVCDGEGHFARDCKAKINQISLEHIRQIGMALQAHSELGNEEEDEFEDDDEAIFGPLNEEEEEEEENDSRQEHPEPNEESADEQDEPKDF